VTHETERIFLMTDETPDTGADIPAGADSAAGLVAVPRAVAGPGDAAVPFTVLRSAGWTIEVDDQDNTIARWSGHGHEVCVSFLPEGDVGALPAPMADRPLWRVSVDPGTRGPVWEAVMTSQAPAELVAAFLVALADPTPLLRDPLEAGTMLRPVPAAIPPPFPRTTPGRVSWARCSGPRTGPPGSDRPRQVRPAGA
jgi:Domain of unknown function (DUF317)